MTYPELIHCPSSSDDDTRPDPRGYDIFDGEVFDCELGQGHDGSHAHQLPQGHRLRREGNVDPDCWVAWHP